MRSAAIRDHSCPEGLDCGSGRAIAPAAFVGGLLWKVTPALPFSMAGLIGLVGVGVFAVTVEEHDAA